MGFFSWRNQDTGKAIMNTHSHGGHKSTMTDNKGNKFIENSYDGYGVFGGKDYYVLLAEMNPEISKEIKPEVDLKTADEDTVRGIGIDIEFGGFSGAIFPNLNESETAPYQEGEKPLNANGQGHWEEDYNE